MIPRAMDGKAGVRLAQASHVSYLMDAPLGYPELPDTDSHELDLAITAISNFNPVIFDFASE